MFERMGYKDEPMPDFESRYPGRLDGCLEQPFAKFSGTIFYRGVLNKAVALFYFCIKDHPFENGNKRFAVTIMLFFLIQNGFWLNIHPEILYRIAKAVAESEDKPDKAIRIISKHFKPHIEKIERPLASSS